MFCHQCGRQNPDNATMCSGCGASFVNPYATPNAIGTAAAGGTPAINNYLVPAIFATICCCLPFGIVSIVYAAQVNGRLAGGDYEGAKRSADSAKMWFWIAFGLGLVATVAYLGLGVVGALLDAQKGPMR
jgi:hypothetical protein